MFISYPLKSPAQVETKPVSKYWRASLVLKQRTDSCLTGTAVYIQVHVLNFLLSPEKYTKYNITKEQYKRKNIGALENI